MYAGYARGSSDRIFPAHPLSSFRIWLWLLCRLLRQKIAHGTFKNSRIGKSLDSPSSISSLTPLQPQPQLSLLLASPNFISPSSLMYLFFCFFSARKSRKGRVQGFDNYVHSHGRAVSLYACRPETPRIGIQAYYKKENHEVREKCGRGKRGRGRGEVTGIDAYCDS